MLMLSISRKRKYPAAAGIRWIETRVILNSSKSPYNIAVCQFPAASGLTAMHRRRKTFTSFVWEWRREAVQAATGKERFGQRNRPRDQAAIRAAAFRCRRFPL